MEDLNVNSKRKVRPTQRLYVPPAQRCRKSKNDEEINEIISEISTDGNHINSLLQQRLDTLTLSDNDVTSTITKETPQCDINKKIDTTDAESEEMSRAMVNMNRKSNRPIIKHIVTNNILQIDNKTPRITENTISSSANSKTNKQVVDWEDLVNEDDDTIDYTNNDCRAAKYDDYVDDDAEEALSKHRMYNNLADLDHVIELYEFPSSFRTQDLITLYSIVNMDSSYIKWCDETHALLIVGTAAQALRALEIKHDVVKSRPVTFASSIALQTIERSDLRPAMKRPETSMNTARRMITSALGTKSNISTETQKLEREALKKAKELKRNQKRNEQDAWEGNPRPSTA